MKGNDELTAKVPRPIRAPRHLWGLTFKGVFALAAGTIFLTLLSWFFFSLLIDDQTIMVLAVAAAFVVSGGLIYLSIRIDEGTGEMQIGFLVRIIVWKLSRRNVSPEWEGKEEVIYVKECKEAR